MMNLLKKNLPIKILALLVAIVLWFFVMNDQNPSIDGSFTVPLSVVNAQEGYKVTHSEENIKIKVRGPRSLFVAATASEFKAYVDLDNVGEGTQSLKVQTALPQGFELVDVSPENVDVTIEKIIQKQVEADLILTGMPAQGMTVAKINQAVTSVTIEGPKSAVDTVSKVVGYVSLAGNNADFSASAAFTAVNAEGREVPDVKVTPQNTDVTIQLARGLSKKIVSIKPIFVGDLADGYVIGNVRLDPSKIEIAGQASVLDQIESVNTEAISLANATKSTKKSVNLDLPPGITVTDKSVVVSVEITTKK